MEPEFSPAAPPAEPQERKTEETQNADSESGEKKYKTAFFIMTGVVVLLFGALIAVLFIQNVSVQKSEFIADVVERSMPVAQETEAELRVNVNTAGINELTLLPGIGESRANDIIEYRNEYGNFTKPEDLLNVHGIGETTLQNLLPYIVFEDTD